METRNVIFNSETNNNYFLNNNIPQTLLVHPVLSALIRLEAEGTDLSQWLGTAGDKEITINGKPEKIPEEELAYYFDYYKMLKEKNYLAKQKITPISGNEFNAKMMEGFIANSGQITFEVTDLCNLKCRYCGYGELYCNYDERKGKYLEVETAKQLVDYYYKLRESSLNIKAFKEVAFGFYGGEPLMGMDFVKELVAYINAKHWTNTKIKYTMTTNAVLLDKYMDFLVENDFRLKISLDGNKENNDYRVFHNDKSSFEVVYENTVKLKNKYPEYFENSVGFFSVVHNKNSKKEVDDFLLKHFNKTTVISDVTLVGVNPDKLDAFFKVYKDVSKELRQDKDIKYYRDPEKFKMHPDRFNLYYFLLTQTQNVIDSYSKLLAPRENKLLVRTGTCAPFDKKIFLTVNGKLLPCERIHQGYFLGEVDKDGVRLDFQAMADKYNNWHKKVSQLCNRCRNNVRCSQCLLQTDLDAETFECEQFQDAEAFIRGSAYNISLLEKAPLLYYSILNPDASLVKPSDEKVDIRPNQYAEYYWLYLHPYVHLNIKKNHAVMYNTLNSHTMEYTINEDNEIYQLLRKLDDLGNLYVVPLAKSDITLGIQSFIHTIREYHSGDIIDARMSSGKPIQLKPMSFLQEADNDFLLKSEIKLPSNEEMGELLEVVDVYINNRCGQNCGHCKDAYKQFPYCHRNDSAETELSVEDIAGLLGNLKKTATYKINIFGGNILQHPRLMEITELLNRGGFMVDYYIDYLNLAEKAPAVDKSNESPVAAVKADAWLQVVAAERFNALHVLLREPIQKDVFAGLMDRLKPIGEPRFHFEVEKEEDLQSIETLLEVHPLEEIDFHPYFNGKNEALFRDNVYISREAIAESEPGMRNIFANIRINAGHIKKMTVMSNKDVYANVNHSALGKLAEEDMLGYMVKELIHGQSWHNVRARVAPCRDCAYNAICPPISNYEYAIGKYNLCDIFIEG
ncbi:MAG: radical SAM peptide maturase [bacterium]|nr:radical SAM peptide maturase [bacterium]